MVYYWNAPSAKARGKRKEKAIESRQQPSSATTSATPKKGPTTRRRG